MPMTSHDDQKVPLLEMKPSEVKIQELQLGVWSLKLYKGNSFEALKLWNDLRSGFPLFYRLIADIYAIAPGLFTLYLITQAWQGIEGALMMYFSNRLLRAVEAGIIHSNPDRKEILTAIFSRLFFSVLVACLSWQGKRTLEVLRTRVTRHFQLFLMRANLRIDLPTSQDPSSKTQGNARETWQSLETIVSFSTEMLRFVSQLAFLAHLSREAGGPIFTLLSVGRPILGTFFVHHLWDQIGFAFVSNINYIRTKALSRFSSDTYRQDIISGGLKDWIANQYERAHANLGEVSDNSIYMLYSMRNTPASDILEKVVEDLPMFYCAVNAFLNPGMFSVASFAILQQSSASLHQSLAMLVYQVQHFRQSVTAIKAVYSSPDVVNSLVAGNVAYPREDNSDYAGAREGMSFELQNIAFSYPGSQKTEPALKDISLNILPGQLVVIVGSNGSGKSTLIRILSRLYDPTSGNIEIDGLRCKDYSIDDLHRATTLLSQDSVIYPLSLSENIGLGYVDRVDDQTMVEEAAKDGGAWEFMEKLKDGVQTVLDPKVEIFQVNLHGNKENPLHAEMQKVRKTIDISGGEKQRVVAARSFMRFKSGKVKFVAVDEPSSALDAEGELNLFEKLISIRKGKTVIFVTHRFGHLTKHADQIICMKDGVIVESGKHEQLLKNESEYAKLYNIQAGAFS